MILLAEGHDGAGIAARRVAAARGDEAISGLLGGRQPAEVGERQHVQGAELFGEGLQLGGAGDVLDAGALGDQRGAPVDHGVEDRPRSLVAGVLGQDDLPFEAPLERLDGRLAQVARHSGTNPSWPSTSSWS